jgi:hypothetical protein
MHARRLRGWGREHATTTPGRLVLLALVLAAGVAIFGLVATAAERSRANAAQAVRAETEPLLVEAVTLYTALSDANATAAATFLRGGLEPPARRAHYLRQLGVASDALTSLTRAVNEPVGAHRAIATISEQLPVYSGLIEAARANNRQGLPVGAAYLRQASGLLTADVLPAAAQLYAIEARRLSGDYHTGTDPAALVAVAIVAVVALGVLVLALVLLARATRRVFNVPALLGAVLLAAVALWAVSGLAAERSALARARRGSDSVQVLAATRVLLSRAQTDQSLTLVNRGSDQTDPADFLAVMRALSPHGALLGEAAALAQRTGTTAAERRLVAELGDYQAQTAQIGELERSGRIAAAITQASAAPATALIDRLNNELDGQITAAQGRFTGAAADATSSLSGLSLVIPLLAVLAAALALLGVGKRLGEYR